MYISEEQLKGFDSYKYRCIDSSPLSNYIIHPFWNQCVKLCPKWLAPNVLTISGFLLLVMQFVLLSIYDPFYVTAKEGSFPSWVWWFSAFAQFFSHTLDGIDGKQARRTGSSSPLGELFDHGLDSWCVSFFVLNVYSVFGGSVDVGVYLYVLYVTLFAFLLSHWEKYNTGILFLPWGYDLSQTALFAIYVITAIKSVNLWKIPLFGISYSTVFIVVAFGSTFAATPVALYNVYLAHRDGTNKQSSLYEVLLPLISPAIAFSLLHIWIVFSPISIMTYNPRLALFLISVVFSNISCRLVVAQMSGTRCQVINKFLPVLALALSITLYLRDAKVDNYLFWSVTVFLTLAHIHYGIVVVNTLANHFGIKVFSIAKKKD
uniref:Ethanolaminephosphotransferase 1 n=1 Tax=Phallusia mammillata TaxID=59560 RepID=A0A6F9DS63_9ASCI|nr:ethanolaminephosphotransferase 1 [Phallusia mammillata]